MTARPTAGSAAANQYGTFVVHYATPPQVGFVAGLLAGRDLTGDLTADKLSTIESAREGVATGKLNKKHASAAIDLLIDLPELPQSAVAAPASLASDKQVALIRRLFMEKDLAATAYLVWDDTVFGVLTKSEASKTIDHLFTLPRKPVSARAEVPVGMYRKADGTIIRVYLGQRSGRNLAKRLVESDDGWSYSYMGLACLHVSADERMALDEAKAWGRMHGTCCVCGALLTVPESVEAGIGPVCASKGWAS